MEHQFRITCKGKSKVISINGTQEYALSYISGYVQAKFIKFSRIYDPGTTMIIQSTGSLFILLIGIILYVVYKIN